MRFQGNLSGRHVAVNGCMCARTCAGVSFVGEWGCSGMQVPNVGPYGGSSGKRWTKVASVGAAKGRIQAKRGDKNGAEYNSAEL